MRMKRFTNRFRRFSKLDMRKLLAVLVVIMLPLFSRAQLTLDECQRLARENYPLVKQYELIALTTDYTVKNINRGYLPQLQFTAQATYQSDVATLPEALTGMMKAQGYNPIGLDKDQYRLSLDLQQTIYDGGNKEAQKRAARAQSDIQTAEVDVKLYEVRDRINDLFFGILLLDEQISLNEDMQKLLQSNHEKFLSMVDNGLTLQSNADMMRAEYLKARQQHVRLCASRKSFVSVLALFIGKDEGEIASLVKPAAIQPLSMKNNRPELRMFEAQMLNNQAQRKLTSSALLPHLSLFAQGFYGYTGYNMFEDMFSHDLSWNGMVGVRLQWNISKLYTHRNDNKRLDAQQHSIETARETFLFNNNMQRIQEEQSVESYRRMLADDDEIIRLRTSIREASESKLANGVIDASDLLEDITAENQARIEQSSHEIEMLKHIYELKHTINQ